MTFKKFILLSIAVHAAVLLFIYLMPASRQQKPRELVATLVTPEAPPPPALKKPLPLPPAPKKSPAARMTRPRMRPAPPTAVKPLPPPPGEKPVVPGEGTEFGKPLPPGVIPKEGKAVGKAEKGAGKGTGKGTEKSPLPGIPGHGKSFDLFDRGVTEDIARRDTGGTKAGAGRKDSPITMDTKNYLYSGYLSMLRQKIESIWVYPPEASAKRLYGDLQIQFTIKKDGTLGAVELVRTSGYQILDAAAIKALKDGAPYWPLPDSWGKKEYTILGHFVYNIYGYGIK